MSKDWRAVCLAKVGLRNKTKEGSTRENYKTVPIVQSPHHHLPPWTTPPQAHLRHPPHHRALQGHFHPSTPDQVRQRLPIPLQAGSEWAATNFEMSVKKIGFFLPPLVHVGRADCPHRSMVFLSACPFFYLLIFVPTPHPQDLEKNVNTTNLLFKPEEKYKPLLSLWWFEMRLWLELNWIYEDWFDSGYGLYLMSILVC